MRRMLIPLLLIAMSVGLGVAAYQADAEENSLGTPEAFWPQTPVISPRRVPVMLQRPAGDDRLWTAAISVLQRAPENTCILISESQRRIVNANSASFMVPASNQKLLLAYTILNKFGPERVYTTEVQSTAPVGTDGVIDGDLWFVGGGDPVISTDDFANGWGNDLARTDLDDLADSIAEAGVTQITGQILGDDTRYDESLSIETWPDRDYGTGSPGALDALLVNRGFTNYATIPDQLYTPSATTTPSEHAVNHLITLLGNRGISVNGGSAEGTAPPGLTVLASISSPPMSEIVSEMLTASDNTVAELLVKELGVVEGRGGSTIGGLAAMQEFLEGEGLFPEGSVLADGSGLHGDNRVQCDVLLQILERSGPTSSLVAGLAIAGESGTLKDRYEDNSLLIGSMRAKTGTLNESTALSGYLDTLQTFDVAFVFVSNAELVTTADTDLQDELAESLLLYPEGPPKSQLSPASVSDSPPEAPEDDSEKEDDAPSPSFEGAGFEDRFEDEDSSGSLGTGNPGE